MMIMRLIERFIHYLQYEKRYSDHTLVAYRSDISQFTSFAREQYSLTDWTNIEAFHLRSWIFDLVEKKLSKRSINRKVSSLRSFFEFMKREGEVEENPVHHIQAIKTAQTLPEIVPVKVMRNFLDSPLDDLNWKSWRDHVLIGFLYEAGMRRAELGGLKWRDLDLRQNWVLVTGKRNKQRQIPLRPAFSNRVAKYKEIMTERLGEPLEYVLLTDRGQPTYPKWIYNRVRYLLMPLAHSEKLSPHVLRHSIATHLLTEGADIQIIKEFLGHSSLAATQIYTQNSIEKLKRTYKNALPDLDQIH